MTADDQILEAFRTVPHLHWVWRWLARGPEPHTPLRQQLAAAGGISYRDAASALQVLQDLGLVGLQTTGRRGVFAVHVVAELDQEQQQVLAAIAADPHPLRRFMHRRPAAGEDWLADILARILHTDLTKADPAAPALSPGVVAGRQSRRRCRSALSQADNLVGVVARRCRRPTIPSPVEAPTTALEPVLEPTQFSHSNDHYSFGKQELGKQEHVANKSSTQERDTSNATNPDDPTPASDPVVQEVFMKAADPSGHAELFPTSTIEAPSRPPAAPKRKRRRRPTTLSPERMAEIQAVFVHWQNLFGYHGRSLTPERIRWINQARNCGFTVEQLCAVQKAVQASPWHMGENDAGRCYNEFENMYRNPARIEGFLAPKRPQKGDRPWLYGPEMEPWDGKRKLKTTLYVRPDVAASAPPKRAPRQKST